MKRRSGRSWGPWVAAGVAVALAGCSGGEASTSESSSSSSSTTSAASSPALAPKPLAGRTIVLDPGHNGGNASNPAQVNRQVDAGGGKEKACNTTGTETNDGYPEHAQVWDVASRLAPLLRAQGATVVLTRSSDTGVGPCVDERGKAGAKAKADAVLSIHADGVTNASARGYHAISAPSMSGSAATVADSRSLAVAVRDAFAKTGMPRAGYLSGGSGLSSRSDLAGLTLSSVPTAMIESGNMRNAADAALLKDPTFRQREAQALSAGLVSWLKDRPKR